jgi:protein TonB
MNKLEGDVTVEFTVNAQGTVQNIKVINSTSPLFDLAAIDAVSRFKYSPAKSDGQAAATSGVRERFRFRLLNGGTLTSVTSSSG